MIYNAIAITAVVLSLAVWSGASTSTSASLSLRYGPGRCWSSRWTAKSARAVPTASSSWSCGDGNRAALNLNPSDAQLARYLHLSNPNMPRHELARMIPISHVQADLIVWMRDDLDQYVDDELHHLNEFVRDNADCDRNGDNTVVQDLPSFGVFKELRESLAELSAAVDNLDQLTQRDLHRLVSVFVTPDNGESERRQAVDVSGPVRRPGPQQLMWPMQAYVFTNLDLGYARMAMSYGLSCHYLGLCSHRTKKRVLARGCIHSPYDLLYHDLQHAVHSCLHLVRDDYWPAIHARYREWRRQATRPGPDRTLVDIVYFYKTHELARSNDPTMIFWQICEQQERHKSSRLADIAGLEWQSRLRHAIDRVQQFWMDHVPSARFTSHRDR